MKALLPVISQDDIQLMEFGSTLRSLDGIIAFVIVIVNCVFFPLGKWKVCSLMCIPPSFGNCIDRPPPVGSFVICVILTKFSSNQGKRPPTTE